MIPESVVLSESGIAPTDQRLQDAETAGTAHRQLAASSQRRLSFAAPWKD